MSEHARSDDAGGPLPFWELIRALLLRELALGLVVYVCSVPERSGNALLGLTLLVCAMLWSSWRGVLPRAGRYGSGITFVEGVLLYVGAIAVANLLRLSFGQHTVGW